MSTPKSTPDRHFGWQRGCKANRAGTIHIRSRGMSTVSRALEVCQFVTKILGRIAERTNKSRKRQARLATNVSR